MRIFPKRPNTHTHTHANYLFLLSFGYNGDSARPRLPASFVCAVTLYVVNLRRPGFESFTFDHTEGVAFDRNNNDNTHTRIPHKFSRGSRVTKFARRMSANRQKFPVRVHSGAVSTHRFISIVRSVP